MNVFAHTEPDHSNPAYVSLNRVGQAFHLTVRSRGSQTGHTVELSPAELQKLAADIQRCVPAKG